MIEIPVGFAWLIVIFHAFMTIAWKSDNLTNIIFKLAFLVSTLLIFAYIVS